MPTFVLWRARSGADPDVALGLHRCYLCDLPLRRVADPRDQGRFPLTLETAAGRSGRHRRSDRGMNDPQFDDVIVGGGSAVACLPTGFPPTPAAACCWSRRAGTCRLARSPPKSSTAIRCHCFRRSLYLAGLTASAGRSKEGLTVSRAYEQGRVIGAAPASTSSRPTAACRATMTSGATSGGGWVGTTCCLIFASSNRL